MITYKMINETTKPTHDFLSVLEEVKTDLEHISNHRTERDEVLSTYKTKLLPKFLRIRQLNRISKDKLEARYDEIRQINQRLASLSNHWENLTFEASCLNHEVNSSKERLSPQKSGNVTQDNMEVMDDGKAIDKDDTFEPDQVGKLSHIERTKVLEAEVAKRKQLCEKLDEVLAETNEIEQVCQASEQQINRVKPYIKQLLDKVDTGDSNSPSKLE